MFGKQSLNVYFPQILLHIFTIAYIMFSTVHEKIVALSLATRHHVTSASASLNVTSHLWLPPVLLIA